MEAVKVREGLIVIAHPQFAAPVTQDAGIEDRHNICAIFASELDITRRENVTFGTTANAYYIDF